MRSETALVESAPAQVDPLAANAVRGPSNLYRGDLWQLGISACSALPPALSHGLSRALCIAYSEAASRRRETVIENLLPVLNGDRGLAEHAARNLFANFGQKLVDLWRYEGGADIEGLFSQWSGWEYFEQARAEKRGILLVTPHLGNWEFGAPPLAKNGIKLLVITLEEPHDRLTQIRLQARARWGVETLVIGRDPFVFVEIIRRLEAGAAVALLMDRPPQNSSVEVQLFGRPFRASIAAAELARASGCVILPVCLPRTERGYAATVLGRVDYERSSLRDRIERTALTQRIMNVFEPVIRQYCDQWYHFVPIWA